MADPGLERSHGSPVAGFHKFERGPPCNRSTAEETVLYVQQSRVVNGGVQSPLLEGTRSAARSIIRSHAMFRPLIAVIATGAALLCATAVHAGGTHWSVGINVPVGGVVVSNGGYYVQEPAPVYYPVPARYAPRSYYEAPATYYEVPRAVYVPPPVVYAEPEPVYAVPYVGWRGGNEHHWEHRHDFEQARWERARHEHGGRWERGEHRGDDGDARHGHRD